MRVAFRVDAATHIGSGHVMRCVTLASALREQGAEILFICREHQGNMNTYLRSENYKVYSLPMGVGFDPDRIDKSVRSHAGWLAEKWETDLSQTQEALKEFAPMDLLVVDHYALDAQWESGMRAMANKILVIDDLADRQHDCDFLLDQTLSRDAADYASLVPSHCQLLMGARFALLRPEFLEWREYSLKRRATLRSVEHLLIAMGGVDKDNVTCQILAALQAGELPEQCCITIVLGDMAPHLQTVREQAVKMQCPAEVIVGAKNMAEIMAKSDLAIGAAGTSSWERCCLGLPSIVAVLADNQRLIAESLDKLGVAVNVGDVKGVSFVESLVENCLSLFHNEKRRTDIQARAASFVSGKGVSSVLQVLSDGGLK